MKLSFIFPVVFLCMSLTAAETAEVNGVVSPEEEGRIIAQEAAAGRLTIIDPVKEKSNAVLPASFDRSTGNAFPPVGSQAGGSCTGWATTYYGATFQICTREGWNAKTGGNAFWGSPHWTYNYINNGGDNGGSMTNNNAMMMQHGVGMWADFPQGVPNRATSWCVNPAIYRKASAHRMLSQSVITNVNTADGLAKLKEALMNPLIGITYSTNSPSSGSHWVWSPVKDDPSTTADDAFVGQVGCSYVLSNRGGLHAMAVCGWNDDIWIDVNGNGILDLGEKGALKMPNSHGTSTGTKGYYWLAYDALNPASLVVNGPTDRDPAFLGQRVYLLQHRAAYTPRLFAEFTLQTAARIDVVLRFLRTKTTATAPFSSPDASWQGYVFGTMSNSSGNRLGFDGNNYSANPDQAPDGSFAFDLTDIVPTQGSAPASWRCVMAVQDRASGMPVTVKSFKVIIPGGNLRDSVFTCLGTPLTVDIATNYLWIDIPNVIIASVAPETQEQQPAWFRIASANDRRICFSASNNSSAAPLLRIFSITGRKVFEQKAVADGSGRYQVTWDPGQAATGTYVATFTQGGRQAVKRFSVR